MNLRLLVLLSVASVSMVFSQTLENTTQTLLDLRGAFQVITASDLGNIDGSPGNDYEIGGVFTGESKMGIVGAAGSYDVSEVQTAMGLNDGRLVLWDSNGYRWEVESNVAPGGGENLRFVGLNINGHSDVPSVGRGALVYEEKCGVHFIPIFVAQEGTGISAALQAAIETHTTKVIAQCMVALDSKTVGTVVSNAAELTAATTDPVVDVITVDALILPSVGTVVPERITLRVPPGCGFDFQGQQEVMEVNGMIETGTQEIFFNEVAGDPPRNSSSDPLPIAPSVFGFFGGKPRELSWWLGPASLASYRLNSEIQAAVHSTAPGTLAANGQWIGTLRGAGNYQFSPLNLDMTDSRITLTGSGGQLILRSEATAMVSGSFAVTLNRGVGSGSFEKIDRVDIALDNNVAGTNLGCLMLKGDLLVALNNRGLQEGSSVTRTRVFFFSSFGMYCGLNGLVNGFHMEDIDIGGPVDITATPLFFADGSGRALSEHFYINDVTVNSNLGVAESIMFQRGGAVTMTNIHMEDSVIGLHIVGTSNKIGRVILSQIDLYNGASHAIRIDAPAPGGIGGFVSAEGVAVQLNAGTQPIIFDAQNGPIGLTATDNVHSLYKRTASVGIIQNVP